MAAFAHKSSIFFRKSRISCLSHYLSTCTTGSINKTQTLLNVVPKDSQFLIEKYHFSQETASKVSSFLKNPERADSVLEFLQETGFSDTQLEKMVIYDPQLVYSRLLPGIKSKIKCFEDFGFSAIDIVAIVVNNPSVLSRSAINRIIPSLSLLKGLLGSNARVTKLLTKRGWCMRTDLRNNMLPNVEFLKSCGVSVEQISGLLCCYLQFFLLTPENMRRYVDKVDEMGVDRGSKMFIHAVRVVSSMSDANWEVKLQTFRDLGFSEDGIIRVFRSDATVLAVSGQKIRKVIEVLLETGKYDLSSIRNCPASLRCSVDKRYKPRLQILKELEKKGLISKWPGLRSLRIMTDNQFHMRYVALLDDEVGKHSSG